MTTPMTAPGFTFTAPEALPANSYSVEELEAHRSLVPAAQAHSYALEALATLSTEAEQIAGNDSLSAKGQRLAFTEMAAPALAELNKRLAALDAAEAGLQSQAEALRTPPEHERAGSPTQRAEWLAMADAFGKLPEAERDQRFTDMVAGRDAELAAALANVNPLISRITPNMQALLRGDAERGRVQADKLDVLRASHRKLTESRRVAERVRDALVAASDRATLQARSLVPLRRQDMSDEQKVAFIGAHGLAAFQALEG